jgi:hypothetical protein
MLALVLVAAALTAPAAAAAHVNRTVGAYTILVVLVEEPTYEDNHAGFQFWVRRGDTPVLGLEGTVEASASGHGLDIPLVVPPLGPAGFYVLDHDPDGAAFDPRGGGAWTLTLTGSIEGTPLLQAFPVTFPSYPRIGTPNAPAAVATSSESDAGLIGTAVVAVLLAAVGAGLAFAFRRSRGRAAAPV